MLDVDFRQQEVLKAFRESQSAVGGIIEEILEKLKAHSMKEPRWDRVGTLNHVESLLKEIDEFFD